MRESNRKDPTDMSGGSDGEVMMFLGSQSHKPIGSMTEIEHAREALKHIKIVIEHLMKAKTCDLPTGVSEEACEAFSLAWYCQLSLRGSYGYDGEG